MKVERKYYMIRGDAFQENLWKVLRVLEDKEHQKNYNNIFLAKHYQVNHSDTKNQKLYKWEQEWFLEQWNSYKECWRKYNFLDLVWIKVITALKERHLTNPEIRRIKECLFEHKKIFEFYVFRTFVMQEEIKLIIHDNYEADFCSMEELHLSDTFHALHDRITISLSGIIENMTWKELERKIPPTRMLCDKEYDYFLKIFSTWNGNSHIAFRNGMIKKFTQSHGKQNIQNTPEMNLRATVQSNKNSRVCFITNNFWWVDNITTEKIGV